METAYSKISQEKTDILIFAGKNYLENKFVYEISSEIIERCIQGTNTLDEFISLNIVVWDKMFRTEFIKENNIAFPAGLTLGEDGIFCYQAIFAGAKYSYLNKCLINHNDSVENSATSKCVNGIQVALKALKHVYNLKGFQAQDQNLQLSIVDKFCGSVIYYWEKLGDENYRAMLYKDTLKFRDFVEEIYPVSELQSQLLYRRFIKRIKQYKGAFPYNILCKTKFRTFKQFRVLGIEWKVPLKKQT